jgi:hypothetical protein
MAAFAWTLKTALKAFKDLVNDSPYNYGIHLSLDPAQKTVIIGTLKFTPNWLHGRVLRRARASTLTR